MTERLVPSAPTTEVLTSDFEMFYDHVCSFATNNRSMLGVRYSDVTFPIEILTIGPNFLLSGHMQGMEGIVVGGMRGIKLLDDQERLEDSLRSLFINGELPKEVLIFPADPEKATELIGEEGEVTEKPWRKVKYQVNGSSVELWVIDPKELLTIEDENYSGGRTRGKLRKKIVNLFRKNPQ